MRRGGEGCLEYTALINIRPAQDNPSMEILDAGVCDQVRQVVLRLVGQGEAL